MLVEIKRLLTGTNGVPLVLTQMGLASKGEAIVGRNTIGGYNLTILLSRFRLGESHEKRGAFTQAAEAYEKALALNPSLLSATAKLAQLYAGPLHDNEKALKFARTARKLTPNDPKIIGILGAATYQAGNFTWAYSFLQENPRRLPDDAKILYDFAWAAYSLGKVSEARQAMQARPHSGARFQPVERR